MMKKTALTLLATMALAAGASAQLLSYDVAGTVGGVSPTATVGDPGVSGSVLMRGSTLTASTTNNTFASTNWNVGVTTADFSTATGKYEDFTITPMNGGSVTLTNLQFAVNGSNTAPNQGAWSYSVDGGTTFTLGTTADGGVFTIPFTGPTTLSTWDFTDFTSKTAVDFRFTAYGNVNVAGNATAPANTGVVRIFNIAGSNDLVLNGTFAAVGTVPEPKTASFIVGAMALFGLVIFRRSRAA